MSYKNGTPNGVVYIGNVKWDNQYKDIMLFKNENEKQKFFTTNFKKLNENIIFNNNNYIDVNINFNEAKNYNYIVLKFDSDFSSWYWYYFITNYELKSVNVIRLYIELDVITQYINSITFNKSIIERAHILKSKDNFKNYNLPEPINFTLDFEKEINKFNINWTPIWLLRAVSGAKSEGLTDNQYEYGGVGSGDNSSGLYCFDLGGNVSNAEIFIKRYIPQNITDNITNHTQDIVDIIASPQWAQADISDVGPNGWVITNRTKTVNSQISVDNSKLINGYIPKNKKLLSSAFRVFNIYNKNGVNIPLKPELLTGNNISITLSMKTLIHNQFYLQLKNYNAISNTIASIPYSVTTGVAYNSNTGTEQALKVLNGVSGVVSSVGGIATGIAGAIATGGATAGSAISGTITGVSGLADNLVNLKSAFEQQTATVGKCNDIISILDDNISLRVMERCPTFDECSVIDDYLTAYGYKLLTIDNVKNYLNTRNNFNYIKTIDIDFIVDAPQDIKNKIKSIFNNGVRFWHNYNNFGNLEVENI